jgi:hypothetical protein
MAGRVTGSMEHKQAGVGVRAGRPAGRGIAPVSRWTAPYQASGLTGVSSLAHNPAVQRATVSQYLIMIILYYIILYYII